ncbi:MAG: hypothetical protein ACM3L9_08570 [Deltaproteobacteria bacterium]
MFTRRPFVMFALAAGVILSGWVEAEAGFRRDRGYNGLEQGFVVANSRFGNGSVKGAVRRARDGNQVQLPGGTWVYCRASCSETLRVETVDIFENQGSMIGYGTAPLECGIFGCLGFSMGW